MSLGLCVLVVGVAFISYYGQTSQHPPLLNSDMKLWTIDPLKNISTPYLWQVDIIKGQFDNASIFRSEIGGRNAIAMEIDRTNRNNTSVWTTIHLRQDMHGLAVKEVFNAKILLWVYPTFSYRYDKDTRNPENAFGVEINDGENLAWFIYTDNPSQIFQLPHMRIVQVQTPLRSWSLRQINIGEEFHDAGWRMPDSLSFTLLLGTTQIYPGLWKGYFQGLTVEVQSSSPTHTSLGLRSVIISGDALVILGSTLPHILAQRYKAPGTAYSQFKVPMHS